MKKHEESHKPSALPLITTNAADVTITITANAVQRKGALIAAATPVLEVTNPEQLQIAVLAARDIKAFLKEVENTRQVVKAPVLALGKAIDNRAAEFTAELEAQANRIQGLVTNFTQQEEARRLEQQRQIEREQAEAQRKLDEARAKAEKAATPKAEIKAERELTAAFAAVNSATAQVAPPVARVTGMISKKRVVWEVTDAAALYAVKPEWFELVPRKSVINALVTKDTQLPGLKVKEEAVTNIRA